MSLLLDIQDAAADSKSDVASLLLRCKILAARLGSKPLEDWLIFESNGYPEKSPLPDYRVWGMLWKGDFSGYCGSSLSNAMIPTARLPKELRTSLTEYRCRDSVASIQSMLAGAKSQTFSVTNPNIAVAIGQTLYQDMNCIGAWGEFGTERLAQVLNAVRNRVLDFVLAVWKEEPSAGEVGGDPHVISPTEVTQIFNTTVYGGGANVIGTATGSTIAVAVVTGDRESLKKQLREHHISDGDCAALEEALSDDPAPVERDKFGPRVARWISAMIEKAATGAWDVGIAAGGELLAKVIGQYYGMP